MNRTPRVPQDSLQCNTRNHTTRPNCRHTSMKSMHNSIIVQQCAPARVRGRRNCSSNHGQNQRQTHQTVTIKQTKNKLKTTHTRQQLRSNKKSITFSTKTTIDIILRGRPSNDKTKKHKITTRMPRGQREAQTGRALTGARGRAGIDPRPWSTLVAAASLPPHPRLASG